MPEAKNKDAPAPLAVALNPSSKHGWTLLERFGPLAIVIAWLGVTVAIVVGLTPSTEAAMAAYGALSGAAGYFIRSQGGV